MRRGRGRTPCTPVRALRPSLRRRRGRRFSAESRPAPDRRRRESCTARIPMRNALLAVFGVTAALPWAFGCGNVIDTSVAAKWALCGANSECVLAANTCCGVCGKPALTDVDAVNKTQLGAHRTDVCPKPVPCPQCLTSTNPDLLATCDAGRCKALDVHTLPATACSRDDECRLRVTGCCECGGSTEPAQLIAVSNPSLYVNLVCDPSQACPACAPVYPTSVEAYCAPDAHCAVRPATAGCTESECAQRGLTCCGDRCVGTYNDIFNCGACGNECTGASVYCNGTECSAPPCSAASCAASETCCGSECCAPGELCCTVPGPGPGAPPRCVAPDGATGSCPIGCPLCQ